MKYLKLFLESVEFGLQIFIIGSVIYFWTLVIGGIL